MNTTDNTFVKKEPKREKNCTNCEYFICTEDLLEMSVKIFCGYCTNCLLIGKDQENININHFCEFWEEVKDKENDEEKP